VYNSEVISDSVVVNVIKRDCNHSAENPINRARTRHSCHAYHLIRHNILSYLSACHSVEPLIWCRICFYRPQHSHSQCLEFHTYADNLLNGPTNTISFFSTESYNSFPLGNAYMIGSLSHYISYENRFLHGYISYFLLSMLKVGDLAPIRRICDAHADRGVRVRPIPPVAPTGTSLYLLSHKQLSTCRWKH
jgi:hypothetical protein